MDNCYGLTFPQKNIWDVEKYYGKTELNNIVGLLYIKYGFDEISCKSAVNQLVHKNDALRLQISIENGQVMQRVSEYSYFDVDYFDISDNSKTEKELNIELAKIPFEIEDSPLYYFAVVRTGKDAGYIYIKLHHLVSDAWTYSQVAEQLSKFILGMQDEVQPFSYVDFIESEKAYSSSERFESDRIFWQEYLAGFDELVKLKENYKQDNNTAKRYTVQMSEDLNQLIKDYSKANRVSPYTIFINALAIYMHRVTGKQDLIIGTPVLNRSNAKEKKMMGMFVSTMPVRFKIDENLTFADFCKLTGSETLKLFRHQKYPYSLMLEEFKKNSEFKSNLYSVMFSYQNARFENEEQDRFSTGWEFSGKIQDELEVHVMDMDETGVLQVHFDYLTSLFEDAEIEYLAKRIFVIIQDGILNNKTIEQIEIMSKEEKDKILYEFNDTKRDYPKDRTVIDLFEDMVRTTPNNLAISYMNEKFSYNELDEKANQIANALYGLGIGKGDVVGIMQQKSIAIVYAILGILKCGGVYVPIDPNSTIKSKRHIIHTAGIKLIVTDSIRAAIDNVPAIALDEVEKSKNQNTKQFQKSNESKSDDINSIMFTSGTTGAPKGVIITNKNIIKLVKNTNYIKFEKEDKMLQTASFTFDASTLEMWNALLNGVPLYMINEELKNPDLFQKYIIDNKITVIFLTSALFNQMVSYNPNMFKGVRIIMTGGEAMSKEHACKLLDALPTLLLKNLYGPTENAVVSTYYNVNGREKIIPIGKPVFNTKCFVLNKQLDLMPIGVKGILYLAGDGISNGYINNQELTDKKFINTNFGRLYNTGDIAEFKCDGNIIFGGREDSEVKIKGMRVDLEEIKEIVNRYSHIERCEVMCLEDNNDNKYLAVAFVSAQQEDIVQFKDYLRTCIVPSLIPRKIIQLQTLPLTQNAKIDRQKLVSIFQNVECKQVSNEKMTGIYLKLYNLFKDVLETKDIDMDSDFFELGGDSILAISLITKAVKSGIELTYDEIYKYRTIREIGRTIEKNGKDIQKKNDISNYDYSNIEKLIKAGRPHRTEVKDVMLSGATGFLGMHIIADFLENFDGKIYCLVRNTTSANAKQRFLDRMRYYFENKYEKYIDSRIVVIEYSGEFIEQLLDNVYIPSITHFINSLAIVKHYGNEEEFFNINVLTAGMIAEFCEKHDIEMLHISTISVSGDIVETAKRISDIDIIKKDYTENMLYSGQVLDNVYAESKFLAERLILEKMDRTNLKAKILRMGNLFDRYSDYKFQINERDNAFSQRLKSLIELGTLPEKIKEQAVDFTPVDYAARSINTLLGSSESQIIYHLFNSNKVKIRDIVSVVNNLGINLKFGGDDSIAGAINQVINDGNEEKLRGIMVDIASDQKLKYITDVNVEDKLTRTILKNHNFIWPKIDKNYLEKIINRLMKRG